MAREQERAALHKTIWQMANDLRGSVDGWDFKQYVLGLLFYRFISQNLTKFLNERQRMVEPDFEYANISDEQAEIARSFAVSSKGFFI
ncbi:type I restriction-modification system subunit M, partial [bacterium]|nr:type I restriction-modification system subunit M [bacterium]